MINAHECHFMLRNASSTVPQSKRELAANPNGLKLDPGFKLMALPPHTHTPPPPSVMIDADCLFPHLWSEMFLPSGFEQRVY